MTDDYKDPYTPEEFAFMDTITEKTFDEMAQTRVGRNYLRSLLRWEGLRAEDRTAIEVALRSYDEENQ